MDHSARGNLAVPRVMFGARPTPRASRIAFLVVGLALLVAAFAPSVSASEPAPGLVLRVLPTPTSFSEADFEGCESDYVSSCDQYVVTAINAGAKSTSGTITLKDVLPLGMPVEGIIAERKRLSEAPERLSSNCKTKETSGHAEVSCTLVGKLEPDQALAMIVTTRVLSGVLAGETNVATVSGGGAPPQTVSTTLTLDKTLPYGMYRFEPAVDAADGTTEAIAGGHPYEYRTRLDFNSKDRISPAGNFTATTVEDPRNILIDLPPGFIGSGTASPYCKLIDLASEAGCPTNTKVGQILTEPLNNASVNSGLYNIQPEAGVAAEFGFIDQLNNVHVIYASVVPTAAGYTTRATTPEAPAIPLNNAVATFFGNPAEKSAKTKEEKIEAETAVPFFTNPAECSGQPLDTHLITDAWQEPGTYNSDGSPNLSDPSWVQVHHESAAVEGCEALHFEPTLEATPETNRADSPTGLEVTLRVPQSESVQELGTPPLRKAIVALPQGMTVNPSSANGLIGCSLADIGISASGEPNAAQPHCPDASKIGSVELETPALPGVLQGQIFVAKQSENPFGTLLAIYIVVNDPTTGVIVKLPGEVRANPATGQLTTVVDNSPQFPFSVLHTKFFGGQRAALRTPPTCGTYKVTSELTPWSAPASGPPATPSSSFKIAQAADGSSCPTTDAQRPNSPSFSAGTLSPLAGVYSPFTLHLARPDGSQEFSTLSVNLPPGLVGKLAGLSECPEAALAATATKTGRQELVQPSCPASSEVGGVTVGAGAGLAPYYATGHVYLAGPYKGAPLSLAVITPAVAGPYDLGDVLVRNALEVDSETTRITAVSDEIPHILQGIPLDVRSIALQMSRNQFTLNPTNCERFSVSGTETSTLGSPAALSNPFQVGGCGQLGFAPKLRLALKGKINRTANPRLIADLTYPKGSYANIAKAQVKLPPSAFIDNAHIGTVCTKPQFFGGAKLGEKCPLASIYGKAKAISPLLDHPVEGPVFLRSAIAGHKLPDLAVALNGQIDVVLVGKTDSVKGALRNTFEAVPDAPVSSFHLELFGAKKGLIEMSNGFCQNRRATIKFTGQNGKVFEATPSVVAKCPKARKHQKKARTHKRAASREGRK